MGAGTYAHIATAAHAFQVRADLLGAIGLRRNLGSPEGSESEDDQNSQK
jgi:hypothetical protein